MLFYSTSKNEVFYGGAGRDTVVFSSRASDYDVIIRSNSEFEVRDYGPGVGDGIDTLFSIERLEFTNGTLAFDLDGNAGQAYRLYQAAFDRTPDTNGLSYWIDQLDDGASLRGVASAFIGSAEFRQTYGPHMSSREFVTELYYNVLGRAGEKAGVDYWTDEIYYGASRAEVLTKFSESVENVKAIAPVIQDGIFFV